ncbi:unnamed protein product [Malus baccata var. baccata]
MQLSDNYTVLNKGLELQSFHHHGIICMCLIYMVEHADMNFDFIFKARIASQGAINEISLGPLEVPSRKSLARNLRARTPMTALETLTRDCCAVVITMTNTGWILDSGATDHMTYDRALFQSMKDSHRKCVATANGTTAAVVGAGTDIQIKEIIGRGTKREGLYYVDDVVPRRAHLVHSSRNRNLQKMVKTQYSIDIKVLRSDNSGEYIASELSQFLQDRGIIHQTTCPHTPQQNGVAERKNRHILETARALLIGASVPKRFWPEAVTYAVYVINHMPSRVVEFRTPLQVLTEHVPVVSTNTLTPRVFGCVAYVHIHKIHRSKLDPCALRCVFVGFASQQKGYKCYHPETRHMYVTMDVTFSESEYFYSSIPSPSDHQGENTSGDQVDLGWLEVPEDVICSSRGACVDDKDENGKPNFRQEIAENDMGLQLLPAETSAGFRQGPTEEAIIIQQPTAEPNAYVTNPNNDVSMYKLPPRQNRGVPPDRFSPEGKVKYPISNYVSCKNLAPERQAWVNNVEAIQAPTRVEEALKDPKWAAAMDEEMMALHKNDTWEVTKLPKGKKPVGCRWVFTIKYKADGSVDRYKARLVAKGYTQTYGIDYQETFSPVAKMNTVRVLISLAANLNWPLKQFDVKNAFLHGHLEEEVYMDFPPGYNAGGKIGVMRRFGYYQSHSDHTLFVKRGSGKVTALIIYVDDMIITGDDLEEMMKLEQNLAAEFDMKNLGDLKYSLGVEVARSSRGIFLSQRKYVLDLLKETGMLGCKPVDTPIVEKHYLGIYPDQEPVDKGRYQRLVGRLIYLSHTRPDIAYAVSVVSQFMHSPSVDHMEAMMRILAYLKSAPGKGVLYESHGHMRIEGFTDADWASDVTDRRSTSGYFTFVGGNLVMWRSKKQNVVSRSSVEAEYRGMAHGVCEMLWLRKLLESLGFTQKEAMKLYCDNKSAREIAENPVQHDMTKHVEVDRHFIKEKLEKKIVSIPFVNSEEQLADVLTHAVCNRRFGESLVKLGMSNIYAPT